MTQKKTPRKRTTITLGRDKLGRFRSPIPKLKRNIKKKKTPKK